AGILSARRIRRAAPLPNSVRASATSLISDTWITPGRTLRAGRQWGAVGCPDGERASRTGGCVGAGRVTGAQEDDRPVDNGDPTGLADTRGPAPPVCSPVQRCRPSDVPRRGNRTTVPGGSGPAKPAGPPRPTSPALRTAVRPRPHRAPGRRGARRRRRP